MRIDGIFDREDMGRAGIEPDVQNVGDLLVIVGLAALAQEALRRGGEPGIGAFGLERLLDALEHGRIVQHLAGFLLDKDRQRHAPGALARQHPVGPAFHHGADAVLRRAADTIWFRRSPPAPVRATSCRPKDIGLSMATNHCGVARKITGALERQLCG